MSRVAEEPAGVGSLARPVQSASSLRDRLLASPRFRRWAETFPLTRPIARRRARDLFDLCAGFVYAQVLYACIQLDLFAVLAEGPQRASALALRLSLSVEATERLLAAAVALRLAARHGEQFGLGPLGAPLVDNPGIVAMVRHHTLLYADLQDPVALLRGDGPARALGHYWAYAGANRPAELDASQVASYTALMAESQPLIAAEILRAYRIGRHRRLLDVGGGDGGFVVAAAASAPRLECVLFDLPKVVERAAARFAAVGIAGRAAAVGGDFLIDPLPTGADVATLVRVIHDHDDRAALSILRAVHRALPRGGTLLLAEPMAGTPGAEPMGDAYFGFYLLAMGSGRPRTPAALAELLTAAGFSRPRMIPTDMMLLTRLIVAVRS